jgi:hypothetical protein
LRVKYVDTQNEGSRGKEVNLRIYNNRNMLQLSSLLACSDWSFVNSSDINNAWNSFIALWNECLNSACPVTTRQINAYRMALPRSILDQIKLKRKLYQKHRSYPMDTKIFDDYKRVKNVTNRSIREHKLVCMKKEFDRAPMGSAEWWKVVKRHFVGNSQEASTCSIIRLSDTEELNNREDIALAFVRHFSAIYTSDSVSAVNKQSNKPKTDTLRYDHVNDTLIRSVIEDLAIRKGNLDKLPNYVLKSLAIHVAKPLSVLIRRSFTHAVFPCVLKTCRVIPLHKGGQKESINNYRPISLQSTFATLIEKVAFDVIDNFIHRHETLSVNQFGFKKNHACVHACLFHLSAIYKYTWIPAVRSLVFMSIYRTPFHLLIIYYC